MVDPTILIRFHQRFSEFSCFFFIKVILGTQQVVQFFCLKDCPIFPARLKRVGNQMFTDRQSQLRRMVAANNTCCCPLEQVPDKFVDFHLFLGLNHTAVFSLV